MVCDFAAAASRSMPEALHDDHEFVAAEPGNAIVYTDGGGEPGGDLLQQQVAYIMTCGVIEGLEIIHVNEQEGAGLTGDA